MSNSSVCMDCRHFKASGGGTIDDPYPTIWCDKGHWSDAPSALRGKPTEPDPWANCKDHEVIARE